MKILFVAPLPDPVTGQSLACQVFLDELTRHHDVDVVNLSKRELKQGISSFSRVREVLGVVLAVYRKSTEADLVYLTVAESRAGNLRDLLIYLLCFPRLSRLLIHLHGGAGMRQIMLGRRGLRRRANELLVRRLAGAIVEGERQAATFGQALPAHRIHRVPNFAEDYLFIEPSALAEKFRNTTPLRVLFLSNLLPGKGHVELVAAYRALTAGEQSSIVMDFAGGFESSAHEQAFRRSIAGLPGLRHHGTVRGEAKRALFHQSHVFCLPTYYPYEGQPLSILEAYAAGCTVITTDHSGIGDVFAPDVNGYLVATRSSEAVKVALQRAVADPERLRAMAVVNRETAWLRYRTAIYNRSLIGIIEALPGG